MRVSGVLELPAAPDAGVGMESLDLSGAYVAFAIRDPRALTTTPELNVGNTSIGFVAGGRRITALPPQLVAPIGTLLADGADTIAFTVDLEFNGTDSLAFVPMGDRTGVTVSSTWPDPSFSGTQLPRTHEISGDGFTAGWEVSEFARPAPSAWVDGTVDESLLAGSAFGVDLYMGVGLYEQSLRAARYAVLFVGLSFVAYFLFETLGQLRLHPLQYLLVGFANVLFYLLLLSLAEHSGFGIAYLLGAVASSSLIVGYSRTVLASDRRALLMAGLLFALYGYLYLVLRAETFAMLAGALGLWVILGTVMYLTRKIDWYRGGEA
jgi:inner membrane protein